VPALTAVNFKKFFTWIFGSVSWQHVTTTAAARASGRRRQSIAESRLRKSVNDFREAPAAPSPQ